MMKFLWFLSLVSRMNKELVSENRVLEENLEKRDQEQRKILAELSEKLQNVVSDNNQSNRQRSHAKASQVKVPAPCRVSGFKMTWFVFAATMFSIRYSSISTQHYGTIELRLVCYASMQFFVLLQCQAS